MSFKLDKMKEKIAIIFIKGLITSEDIQVPFLPMTVPGTSSEKIVSYIDEIKEDQSIKAVIFEINSPGGTPFPCKEIADNIKSLDKYTVAWIREYATSGAYWIASSCKKILADPLSTVGNIGVMGFRPDFSGILEKLGINVDVISSEIHKGLGIPYVKPSKEEEKMIKERIDIIHRNFMEEIAKNRGLDEDMMREISTGKVYLGEDAKKLGLIDDFGGKDKAIEICKKETNITEAEIVYFGKRTEK